MSCYSEVLINLHTYQLVTRGRRRADDAAATAVFIYFLGKNGFFQGFGFLMVYDAMLRNITQH